MWTRKNSFRFFLTLTASTAILVGAASCGKTAFQPVDSIVAAQAPGSFYEPPKVDILLAEDDTGSIQNIYSNISQQLPVFLTQLQSQHWDYHFAVAPLTTDRAMTQVAASEYDTGWSSQWQAPYPGADRNSLENVISSFFRLPTQYSAFIDSSQTSGGASEPGLQTIARALNTYSQGTGFIRPDSLLVVVALGNGQDTSGVTMCKQLMGNGDPSNPANYANIPCEQAVDCSQTNGASYPYCSDAAHRTAASSFNSLYSQIAAAKIDPHFIKPGAPTAKDPSSIRFYAAVSTSRQNNCLGAPSYAGTRYEQMASAFNGQTFDICSNSVPSILSALASNLQGIKLAFETDYLFTSSDAQVNTIQVTKYPGGDSTNPQTIAQNSTNGWSYIGYQSGLCTVKSPTGQCMNTGSGFTIQLHGSAVLMGDDTANVTFTPAGFQNSSK